SRSGARRPHPAVPGGGHPRDRGRRRDHADLADDGGVVRRHGVGGCLAVTRIDTLSDVRLRPLLEPASIAVIAASGRPGRPGHAVLAALRAAGFAGAVHPVTPTYDAIERSEER